MWSMRDVLTGMSGLENTGELDSLLSHAGNKKISSNIFMRYISIVQKSGMNAVAFGISKVEKLVRLVTNLPVHRETTQCYDGIELCPPWATVVIATFSLFVTRHP